MNSTSSTAPEALDRWVAAAAPISDCQLYAAGLDDPLDRLGERILAHRPRPRAPRRRRFAVALLAVAVLLPSAALGGVFSTHTGIHWKPGTENDGTELLRTDAPDFPPLVRKVIADIPFPPGSASLGSRAGTYVRLFSRPGSLVQAAGIKSTVYGWADCAWRGYWLRVHASGQTRHAAMAAQRLQEVGLANRKWDSFWRLNVQVGALEAGGSAWAPAQYQQYYRVMCLPNAHLWQAR